MPLLTGQYRVELEPGLVLTRTLPSIVDDEWWLMWVLTGPVFRQRARIEGVGADAAPFFEFLRNCEDAVRLRQSDGEALPYSFSGGGSEDEHHVRLRLPVNLTSALGVTYVWQGLEVAREWVSLIAE